jgi:DNA-binding NtrC family response regulator
MATILYVDDDPTIGLLLEDTLLRAGHRAVGARNVPQALQALSHGEIELIISDFKMPGTTGLEFLGLLKEEDYDIPLIMVTGFASIEHAVSAIKAGAVDYITKPVRPEQLEHAVTKALQVARLRKENDALRQEVMALRNERQIIGESNVMRRLLQTVATAAPTRATVLLQGESGTGKELVARAIHDQSERADRPFIKLNCAALPEGLVESALFGHERGAFTGAIKRVVGAFERAHGGTLLLDEISEMRLDLQAKLLRVLQEQEFERVGGTSPIKVDVRIVATTNRDLAAEAEAGRFRRDLFFRLSVIPIQLPPLRQRAEDIPLLAYRFGAQAASDAKKEFGGFSPEALALLQRYEWPGNVRELQHTVERAVILAGGPMLLPVHFEGQRFGLTQQGAGLRDTGYRLSEPVMNGHSPDGVHQVVLSSFDLVQAESELITRALEVTEGNRTRAAELLGLSVRTLRNKLNALQKA